MIDPAAQLAANAVQRRDHSATSLALDGLRAAWPLERWHGQPLVVGVSGGSDSVALLRLLLLAGGTGTWRPVVAHFQHHWRGEESLADEQFVRELAERYDCPMVVGQSPEGLAGAGRTSGGGMP